MKTKPLLIKVGRAPVFGGKNLNEMAIQRTPEKTFLNKMACFNVLVTN